MTANFLRKENRGFDKINPKLIFTELPLVDVN
jgi:hypothetical protein